MTNPVVAHEKTPNGGDYSEFWYLDKDGSPSESMETATNFKILELKEDGTLVQTTYGVLH